MKKIIQTALSLLVIISLFQCRKDPDYIGTPDPVPVIVTPDPAPITANLQGNIVDESGLPAAGVSVKAGSQTTSTDAKGYFRINNASLDKKNTLVVAQKTGYFKGMRHFAATSGTNYVFIKLIKKTDAGTVDAAAGGTVTLSNGGTVSLPANGIVVAASGSGYTGPVHVYAQYIDPSATDIAATVPGSFDGIDKDGKNVVLTSYGMMAVELESASGEKLQIKDGSVATLTSPIPSAAAATAPASIPLWFVDEQIGLWREEGTATKQGNNYVGDVKHFTFWNCDFPNASVTLSMTILNPSNLPLVNTAVRITRPGTSWLTSRTDYTDSLGQVSGLVPSNEALLLEVLDPCGNTSYSQNISGLTQDTDLGNITVAGSSAGVLNIVGRLVDCSNQPVTNGYVIITFGNTYRNASTDANGYYEAAFVVCPGSASTASILAVDRGTGGGAQYSTNVVVNLTTPVSNLADIVVCDTPADAYINYNIDGVDYYWTPQNSFQMFGMYYPATGGPGTDATLFQADNQPGPRQFYMNVATASTVGTYPSTVTSTDAFPPGGSVFFLPGFTTTITSYASSWPDYFEGSFSGQYTHSSTGSTVHTINGTFRIQHQ
ncbi:MAG: hypothetical protein QM737_00050 [Ferruginibacter sp.]